LWLLGCGFVLACWCGDISDMRFIYFLLGCAVCRLVEILIAGWLLALLAV
jgi:hypothetical protein